ncbi:Uncharacterised protein [Sphingobacterium daejeonense]|nr:Uncharacterised protein [Sphingobacterium daejeonense]
MLLVFFFTFILFFSTMVILTNFYLSRELVLIRYVCWIWLSAIALFAILIFYDFSLIDL